METITKKTVTEEKTEEEAKYSHKKGWGIDADPENKDIEVHSNERPSVSPVYGTSTPPSGLSGFIRRLAFSYSKSGFGHWLPLIFADRVNIWEGFLHGFKKGKFPKIFREQGFKAELKYNKKQFLAKTAAAVLVGTFVFAWMMTSARKKEKGKRKK